MKANYVVYRASFSKERAQVSEPKNDLPIIYQDLKYINKRFVCIKPKWVPSH
jgi:hypothetical protein